MGVKREGINGLKTPMKREIKDKDTRDLSMVNYRAIERKKTEIGRGREVKREGINGLKSPIERDR